MTLKEYWEGKGLNIVDVASMAKLSIPTLHKLNRKESVHRRTLEDLCRALNITREFYESLDPEK